MIATVPQLLIALWLAHLLNTKLRARTFFRMAVLLPKVTSLVAVALIFTQLFWRQFGLVNWVLGLFGVSHIDWESGRLSSWIALSVMVTWRWTGYNALIYLAALQAIPKTSTRPRRSTVPRVPEVPEHHRPGAAPDHHLQRHHRHDRQHPAVHRTATVRPVRQGPTGGAARQFQTFAMYVYEKFGTHGEYGYAATVSWAMFMIDRCGGRS